MKGNEILKAMDNGFTLHGWRFGFWIMNPIDARCTNVHNGAARSLVKKRLIKRIDDTQYIKTVICTGDEVMAVRRLGHGLAEKGQILTVIDDRDNGWFAVKPEKAGGFLVRRSEIIPIKT